MHMGQGCAHLAKSTFLAYTALSRSPAGGWGNPCSCKAASSCSSEHLSIFACPKDLSWYGMPDGGADEPASLAEDGASAPEGALPLASLPDDPTGVLRPPPRVRTPESARNECWSACILVRATFNAALYEPGFLAPTAAATSASHSSSPREGGVCSALSG